MQNRLSANGVSRARVALFASLFLSLIFLAVFALPPSSRATREAGSEEATKQKRKRPEFVPGEILVRYRSEKAAKRQPRAAMVQSAEGRAIEVQVERFEGSDIVEGLRMARVAAEDTMNAIAALKSQPDVLYAEPNYILHADATPNDPRFGELYGLSKIGAPQAWDTTKGNTSIVVGVIDEGIDLNHPDLQANIWTNPMPGSISGITGDLHGYDFRNNTGTIPAEEHATHVAGTAGAVGNNGLGVVGVNWNVSLMSLKFLGADGGFTSDAVRAYNYAKQMRDLWVSSGGSKGANIRVLNNSYGGGGFSQAAFDAINALNQSGVLFVASNGNDGENTDIIPHYPSGYDAPNVVSVVATDSSDSLASFSTFGAETATIGAPGVSILSTTPNNTYSLFSGTSMASSHTTGAAALISAANPNLTLPLLKSLLIFNGDLVPALNGKTITRRRINVAKSLQALAENDLTPPGTVDSFRIASQSGRSISLAWTASGDDGATGQASLYQLSFTDADTGATTRLQSVLPSASGSPQTLDVKISYRHTNGTITLREFDNAGNEGIPALLAVSISVLDGDPYAQILGVPAALSAGGTPLGLTFDDRYSENYALPFSFPFFGQDFSSVTISTNGNLFFSPPPKRSNGDADDFPGSTADLARFKMIAGLWDDLDLRTSSRADADVYVVQPDSNRIIFRWQGVPCNYQGSGCTGGNPVNFEIELQSNGNIQTRYGSGNIDLFPVVGISGGEPDAYVITTHTSEDLPINLTNAQTVTFAYRAVEQPTVSSLSPNSAPAGGPGFTLTVNGNNFFNGIVVRWNGSDRPTTVVSSTQLTAQIAAADIQTSGTAAVTTFIPGGGISPALTFTITCSCGYEGDVAPRPNGSNNGTITIADWVQVGRFASGLDAANSGCEFQRADSAPKSTLGNGSITISDWVQGGRYASGLDPTQCAGGPSGPSTGPASAVSQIETEAVKTQGANGAESAIAEPTSLNLLSTILASGRGAVSIEFDAQGNENAFGFSLMFDPAKLSFVSAEKSSEASAATLNLNKLEAAKGRIGIALALPASRTFSEGRRQLVVLTFALRTDSSELPAISFTDLPIAREVVDQNANRLNAVFQGGSDADPLEDAQFFVYQHYLDFLSRTPDREGLDYWTHQINECGTDKLCISQRRRAVSAAFFMEQEFQQTGSFVYRLYKAGLGRQLSYAEFAADRSQVIGGANLNQKTALADMFVERAEFLRKYQQHQTAEAFVDVLLGQLCESSQVDLAAERSGFIALYKTGSNTNQSRSQVLRMVIEDASFKQAEYNPSFVLMEYFGYLRRDPDKGGYDFWLNVLNNREPGNYRGLVCAFITSTEYQRRFSKIVSHSNADCSH